MAQKFSITQVEVLRADLCQKGFDLFEVAEAVRQFFTEHGYGIAPEAACNLAKQVKCPDCKTESLHQQLEDLALLT